MTDDEKLIVRTDAMLDRLRAEMDDHAADLIRIGTTGPTQGDAKLIKGMALLLAHESFYRRLDRERSAD